MKTFVISDIHGAYKALMQCLQRSCLDYAQDRLIVIGDVCDGYPQVKQCFDEILKVKHLDYIIGNHDLWALSWGQEGVKDPGWLTEGGFYTVESYEGKAMTPSHVDLLKNAHPFLQFDEKLFVHGGFDIQEPIENQDLESLVWDRELIYDAWYNHASGEGERKYGPFKEIYLGHTSTQNFNSTKPLKLGNIWAIDTGAGWSGQLTIMDIATHKFWQSDSTPQLYPGFVKKGH